MDMFIVCPDYVTAFFAVMKRLIYRCKLIVKTIEKTFALQDFTTQHKISLRFSNITCSNNKVRELATVCLPWLHWTKALVWFHDVDISAFHSCVVDLWQSLSEWHLLLSACVLVCRRENVGA